MRKFALLYLMAFLFLVSPSLAEDVLQNLIWESDEFHVYTSPELTYVNFNTFEVNRKLGIFKVLASAATRVEIVAEFYSSDVEVDKVKCYLGGEEQMLKFLFPRNADRVIFCLGSADSLPFHLENHTSIRLRDVQAN
jgi:hypothetical protein